MAIYTQDELEQRIVELWARRPLSGPAWNEFGRLVIAYLSAWNFSQYATLRQCYEFEEFSVLKRQLIEDFFTDKVFLPSVAEGFRPTVLHSAKALGKTYFSNYLTDRIRRCKTQERLAQAVPDKSVGEVDDQAAVWEVGDTANLGAEPRDDTEAGELTLANEQLSLSDEEGSEEGGAIAAVTASQEANGVQLHANSDSVASGMGEAEAIRASAAEFLATDGRCGWVSLYLGCHQCCDDEDRPALCWLARRHKIKSYATKARNLGITRPHGGYAREAPWGRTLLGEWMASLGIEVEELTEPGRARTRRGGERIAEAMKILCCEALSKVRAEECC